LSEIESSKKKLTLVGPILRHILIAEWMYIGISFRKRLIMAKLASNHIIKLVASSQM